MTVRFDQSLQVITERKKQLVLERAADVEELLWQIASRFPELGKKLFDDAGKHRKMIIVSVNGKDIRLLAGEKTLLNGDEDIFLLHAIAGG